MISPDTSELTLTSVSEWILPLCFLGSYMFSIAAVEPAFLAAVPNDKEDYYEYDSANDPWLFVLHYDLV
jgi:hypothetical protein